MQLRSSLQAVLVALSCWGLESAAAPKGEVSFTREIRPVLEEFCFDCHDQTKSKGGTNLEQFKEESDLWRNPKLWERVLVQLRDRVMPPNKQLQPTEEERTRIASWIDHTLSEPDLTKIARDPGPQMIHRLSRLEYNNTIRDLLGIDSRPADQFPLDGGGGAGFDNNSSTLFLPPVLIQNYLRAAEQVLTQASPERIFAVRPGEDFNEIDAARHSLESFATRSFRRPLQDRELERLLVFYQAARCRDQSWEEAVKLSCQAVLLSPSFLFRIEAEHEECVEPYLVGDYELASRISYFLWSSMPDEELLRAAREGELRNPDYLQTQVCRMLADPKAHDFAENFVSQWLRTKELHGVVQPAPDKYPQFTPEVRKAAYAEPVEFFHALIQENRPLTDCLDANYTFVNQELAEFYGIEGVQGNAMRRITLSDRNRGGVLGMASVLTLTSYPRRTSPVLRGKWVMEEILGTPPPPPPPLVNTRQFEDQKTLDGMTFRQRLEKHRTLSRCSGCHARMDPLGFGLENFDGIGRWRTIVGNEPVDVSGQLVTGQKFSGAAELKQLLLERKDDFVRNVTEKMLAYALGRGIEPADWITVRQIATAVAADGYRTQRLVLEITRSFPFQYRRQAPASLPVP